MYLSRLFRGGRGLLPILCFLLVFSCKGQPEGKEYNDFRFLEYDIRTLQEGYADGRFTVREVTRAYLDRIGKLDDRGPELRAVICVNPDAMKIAGALDRELRAF